MTNIGIFTKKNDSGIKKILDFILKNHGFSYKITEIFTGDNKISHKKMVFDIIIVNFPRFNDDILLKRVASHGNVILNSDEEINSKLSLSRPPLTYGLNPKACVTVSSFGMDSVTCCVQRAFCTIDRNTVVQQEIVINSVFDSASVLPLTAAVACALSCGVNAREIAVLKFFCCTNGSVHKHKPKR